MIRTKIIAIPGIFNTDIINRNKRKTTIYHESEFNTKITKNELKSQEKCKK